VLTELLGWDDQSLFSPIYKEIKNFVGRLEVGERYTTWNKDGIWSFVSNANRTFKI